MFCHFIDSLPPIEHRIASIFIDGHLGLIDGDGFLPLFLENKIAHTEDEYWIVREAVKRDLEDETFELQTAYRLAWGKRV